MVGTAWWFCWISDLSFFKMLFIFCRNAIRRTLLLPSGPSGDSAAAWNSGQVAQGDGCWCSQVQRPEKITCVLQRDNVLCSVPVFGVIFASMSADRAVTESPLQTCFGSTKSRGEMWFVFLRLWNPPAEREQEWGRAYKEKAAGWVQPLTTSLPSRSDTSWWLLPLARD